MKDGDLLCVIRSMLSLRGFDIVKVSKVKGHAALAMVASGDVRIEDVGNDCADMQTWDVYSMMMLSLLVAIFFVFDVFGFPLLWIFIGGQL